MEYDNLFESIWSAYSWCIFQLRHLSANCETYKAKPRKPIEATTRLTYRIPNDDNNCVAKSPFVSAAKWIPLKNARDSFIETRNHKRMHIIISSCVCLVNFCSYSNCDLHHFFLWVLCVCACLLAASRSAVVCNDSEILLCAVSRLTSAVQRVELASAHTFSIELNSHEIAKTPLQYTWRKFIQTDSKYRAILIIGNKRERKKKRVHTEKP